MGLTSEFAGFPAATQAFLGDLAANNDRDWFAAHRGAYETAIRAPAEAFVTAMVPVLTAIVGQPVSGKIFRIHRDVRFSKDKRPYNAHLHIGFAPTAGLSPKAGGSGFYFGLEPDRLALGAGAFEFAGRALDAWRAAVDGSGEEIAAIVDDLVAAGFRLDGPELKRVPAPTPQITPARISSAARASAPGATSRTRPRSPARRSYRNVGKSSGAWRRCTYGWPVWAPRPRSRTSRSREPGPAAPPSSCGLRPRSRPRRIP